MWFAGCTGGSPGVAYDASCSIVSVGESNTEESLLMYPNPADDRMFIQSPGGQSDWEILDASGRLVAGGSSSAGVVMISLINITPGFYLLRVTNEQGKAAVGRFLKE